MSAMVLLMMAIALSGDVEHVGEATVHFDARPGCRTVRATMSGARAGDAVWVDDWKLSDGSFVHAVVPRDRTLEVERCTCGADAGAASVRVRVVRAADPRKPTSAAPTRVE